MPVRGGRSGGGVRGGRSVGGFRAPRASSGSSSGSRGFRIPLGNRTPRAETTSSSSPTPHRPFLRPRMSLPSGPIWKILLLLVALFVFGGCACVGLGFLLQALGYGS